MGNYVLGRGRLSIRDAQGRDIEFCLVEDMTVSFDTSFEGEARLDYDYVPSGSFHGVSVSPMIYPYAPVDPGFILAHIPSGRTALLSSTGLRPREAR